MAEKNNAKCSICGKGYYACKSCSDAMKIHPWKIHTDTAECYKVFQVVRGFSTGVYTKDEAREKLQNVDLKDIDSFRPHIKKIVKDILKVENTVVETVEKMENTVVENVVEVEKTKVANNFEDVAKPTVPRKKFNKMDKWK